MAEAKQIPTLTANDIECRVQSVKKNKSGKVGAVLLIYKDARVDMRILDEVYGVNNWQRTHEVIDGKLFCNIDIWDKEKKTWVRKQDVGTESNTEKEKGQASDAFKRTGFNIGIGRELYTAPFIYVTLNDSEYYTDKQRQKERCYPSTKFKVSHIEYSEQREIAQLVIVDSRGTVRYNMAGNATNSKAKRKQTAILVDEATKNALLDFEQAGQNLSAALKHLKISSIEEMTQEQADKLIDRWTEKVNKEAV